MRERRNSPVSLTPRPATAALIAGGIVSVVVATSGCKSGENKAAVKDSDSRPSDATDANGAVAPEATVSDPAALAQSGVQPTDGVKPPASDSGGATATYKNYANILDVGPAVSGTYTNSCKAQASIQHMIFGAITGPVLFSDGHSRYLCWGLNAAVAPIAPNTGNNTGIVAPIAPNTGSHGMVLAPIAPNSPTGGFSQIVAPIAPNAGFVVAPIAPNTGGQIVVNGNQISPSDGLLPPPSAPNSKEFADILYVGPQAPGTYTAYCQAAANLQNQAYRGITGPILYTDGFWRYICWGNQIVAPIAPNTTNPPN